MEIAVRFKNFNTGGYVMRTACNYLQADGITEPPVENTFLQAGGIIELPIEMDFYRRF